MSRPFLQLCQDVISDLGVSGGTLGSVSAGLNQEQQRIVSWVSRADLFVQNMWSDWTFLWQTLATTSVAGNMTAAFTSPAWASEIRAFDLTTLWYQPRTANAQRIPWLPWQQFYRVYRTQPTQNVDCPTAFSVDPSGVVQLSGFLNANTPFEIQAHGIGNRMVNNADTSPIPTGFDSIICERAKIMYAERENAPEILTGSSAEFSDLLEKMQAFYLPNNRAGRTLQNDPTTAPRAYVE